MFTVAISEKEAVASWVEDFLKNQPVFVKDEKGFPIRKKGIPFTRKDGDTYIVFKITKEDCEILLTLYFKEKGVSLVFSDYKIRRVKEEKEEAESYFESGDSDFEFLKLKQKVNGDFCKDLSKAIDMKKEDWKRRDVKISL
jgi:hypothetical protein